MRVNPDAPGFELVMNIDEATHGNRIDLEQLADRTERNHLRPPSGRQDDPEKAWRIIYGKAVDVAAPGPWIDDAACRGRQHLFVYPATNVLAQREATYRQQTDLAVAICNRCPVLIECRRWALSSPDPATDMIAGGLTPWERRNIRRKHLKALS